MGEGLIQQLKSPLVATVFEPQLGEIGRFLGLDRAAIAAERALKHRVGAGQASGCKAS